MLLILAWMQDRATRLAYETGQVQTIDSYAFVDAGLRNSEVVRGLGMMQTLGAKWSVGRNNSIARSSLAAERQNVYSNLIKTIRLFVQLLIIAAGAYLIMQQKVRSGMLFANMIISARALQPRQNDRERF